jgi:hypothetical protein
MKFREAFEIYLLDTMTKVCPCVEGKTVPDSETARLMVEDSGILPPHSRTEDIERTFLTKGIVGPRIHGAMIADFHQGSIEHRFELTRWPDFQFAVWESPSGDVWGHSFVRRTHSHANPISNIGDLSRWSNVSSEVASGLGQPKETEEWFPWSLWTYSSDSSDVILCFAFSLLQSIQMLKGAPTF